MDERHILLLFALIAAVNCQTNCDEAPTEALKIICRQIQEMDTESRTVPTTSSNRTGLATFSLPNRSENAYQCHDMNCVCMFLLGNFANNVCTLDNGQVYGKGLRKEYRLMSDDERNRFNTALWTIYRNGEYKVLSDIHATFTQSPGAHSGPSFLPWHREFIKRIEIALRKHEPSIALPYWDSTLETNLQNPSDSILFSEEMFGNPRGTVTNGVFANWAALNGETTRRDVGAQQPTPFSEDDIRAAQSAPDIIQTLSFTAPRQGCPYRANFNTIEYTHGKPHIFVGGHMFNPMTSTNDPLFWLHHSFVDLIWENWRQGRQSRGERETSYPPDSSACSSPAHFSNTIMMPFAPLVNKDGLSNTYTDNLYSYAPRPSCSMGDTCGSKYLFCDRSNGQPRCAAKIKIGGNCRGYVQGEQPCYGGTCINGICSAQTQPTPPSTPPVTPPTPPRPTPTLPTIPPTFPPITTPKWTLQTETTTTGHGGGYVTPPSYPGNNNGNNGYPILEPDIHIEPGYDMGPGEVHVEPGYYNNNYKNNHRGNNKNNHKNNNNGYNSNQNQVHVEPGYNGYVQPYRNMK